MSADARDGDESLMRAHGHVAHQSDTDRGERRLDDQQGGDGEQRESLFATKGYAGTAMEDLVAKAGMTRGALYHQYRDKRDLFRAVFEAVEIELGQRIAAEVAVESDPWEQLRAGARAFLACALDPAIRRIVLVDGPSVLGWEEWRRIDSQYSLGMVRAVFEVNIAAGNIAPQPVEPLAHLIVGALNEAALAVAAADDPTAAHDEFAASMDRVLEAMRTSARSGGASVVHQ